MTVECAECGATFTGTTESPMKQLQIRNSCVWATLVSGETYSHSEEFFAHLGVPFMCQEAFSKTELDMQEIVSEEADKSIDRAIDEEKAQTEFTDEEGLKCTTAFIDGSWPVRSYGNRYTSRSGAAVIFGKETKKIIHADTRNTFCIQCYVNTKQGKSKEHRCFLNHSGSAGSIEPEILVDGFIKLLRKGLKIRTVVGDGDSNVFDQLKDRVPYGEELEKANCKNHTIKNLKKHLHTVSFFK